MRVCLIALLVAVFFAAGCDNALDCTQVETFPLEVVPVDAATGAAIADSATVTATRDGVVWPLAPYRTDGAGRLVSLWGASGPGTYALRAVHPRYQPWDTSGVVVEAAKGCTPFVPVQLEARLIVQ